MQYRTSNVKHITVNAISNSSIFNIGDTRYSDSENKAIAVQKEGETMKYDLKFEDFPIFKRKAVWPSFGIPVIKKTVQHHPEIQIQSVDILSISSSSVFQVGKLSHTKSESRIKHIRILEEENGK